jgi:hypothetical protein
MWSAALFRRFCFSVLDGELPPLKLRREIPVQHEQKNKSGGKAPHSK